MTACGSNGGNSSEDEPRAAESSATTEPSSAPESSATPRPTRKPAGTRIDVTFEGGTVDPNGVRRKAAAGKPITFRIVADQSGELHVHSSPEQSIEFGAGTTTRRITIDQPGVVDVESHDPDTLVVQLEVR
jgi:hypothetical protein